MTKGGALKSVLIIGDNDLEVNGGRYTLQQGPAIKVRGFNINTIGNRKVKGGDTLPIYVVAEADMHINGGRWRVKGGQARQVTDVIGDTRGIIQGTAIPVIPVDDQGIYDPTFSGYISKVLNPNTSIGYDPLGLIGFWPQNESGGAISFDLSGLGHDGAYTGVTLGQPGVPGMGMTSPFYDGAGDVNNVYSAGLVADNLLLNPGFETPGAGGADIWANWIETASDGALANEVVVIHQEVDACKMTAGVLSDTRVNQLFVATPGQRYRLRFWTQGDGVNAGVYHVWDATNGADIIGITSTGVTGAAYGMVSVEFTAPAGCISINVFLRCPPVNGGICYYDACEIRPTSGFSGDEGTLLTWIQVAAGAWTDGAIRRICYFSFNAANRIQLAKSNVNNTIIFHYQAGNITEQVATAGQTTLEFYPIAMTWSISGDVMRAFISGVQTGVDQNTLGTWLGDLANNITVIGSLSVPPANIFHGNIGPFLFYNKALTPTQIAYLSTP